MKYFTMYCRFGLQNNVSVNVSRLHKTRKYFNVIPAYLTKQKLEKQVNILLTHDNYFNEEGDDSNIFIPVKFHYV